MLTFYREFATRYQYFRSKGQKILQFQNLVLRGLELILQ